MPRPFVVPFAATGLCWRVVCGVFALISVSFACTHSLAANGIDPHPIQLENAQRGAPAGPWLPPAVPPTNVEGYTSETSVLPGGTVHFHVSTEEGEQYRIEVYRLGWYGGAGARLLA